MNIANVATLTGAVGTIAGIFVPVIVFIRKLANGQRCQLRSEMLRIYYANCESETIHQFEYENFAMLYNAYKALGGNSFIDKLWEDVKKFDIVARKDVVS